MFLWTSYPISVATDLLWQQLMPVVQAHLDDQGNSKNVTNMSLESTHLIELLSAYERVANYGQTGNARVLAKAAMDPLRLAHSVLYGGLPMISDMVRFEKITDKDGQRVKVTMIDRKKWAMDYRSDYVPASSSYAAIKFRYSEEFANVSFDSLLL